MMLSNLEFFSGILDAENENELLKRISHGASVLGFDKCLLAVQIHAPMLPREQRAVSAYPIGWEQEYGEKGYLQVDPIVRHGVSSSKPLVWSDSVYTKESFALMETSHSNGIGYGLCIPLHDQNMSTMMCFARDKPVLDAELKELISGARVLSSLAHMAAGKVTVSHFKSTQAPKLTKRELEVLQWIAIGKNQWEISQILKLSEATVAFHTGNILRKFDVTSRTHVAAKAVALSLIN